MKVKEAVRRLNGYLQRRGKVNGSGGWTEQYLLDLLTDANLDMYHRVVNYGPEIFQTISRFTYEKNQASINLSSKVSGTPMAIWYLGTVAKDEAIGPNNMPAQLTMARRTNLDAASNSGGFGSSTGFQGAIASDPLDPNQNNIAISDFSFGKGGLHGVRAFYLGRELSIRPVPKADIYLYMRWTPDELPALIDDDQDLLGGFLPQFHPAIVYKAAISAKSAKGENTQQLTALYQEVIGQFDSNLKMGCRNRQRQQPQQRDSMRLEY